MESLGTRIRRYRSLLGLDQTELANQAGFKHRQTIGSIESDERAVKASELSRIAAALHVDVATLLSGSTEPGFSILWRSQPEDNQRIQADFVRRCDRYARLLRLLGKKPGRKLPSFPVDISQMTYADADELAGSVGRFLDLGRRPAVVLRDAIEDQYEVLIWYLSEADTISAACCRGDFGNAMLLPRSSVPWRRNYDVAHELFHLLTWDSYNPSQEHDDFAKKRAENLANEFAAALLMPGEVIRREIKARSLGAALPVSEVTPIAAELDVSLPAFLYRLLNLGYIQDKETVERLKGDAKLRHIDKELRQTVRDPEPSLPTRFVVLAYAAWANGRLSKRKLAEFLETDIDGLPRRLAEFGIIGPDERAVDEVDILTEPTLAQDDLTTGFGEDEAPLHPA